LIFSTKSIPFSLVSVYDKVKTGYPKPTLSTFVDLFITYAKLASFMVLFDAFDECNQQGIVYSQLIQRMYNSGIRIFITHRPHVLQNPEVDFEEFTRLEIRAQSEDIENYISKQLDIEETAKCLDGKFKDTIKNEIRDHANGM
jgi:hypothetical protein